MKTYDISGKAFEAEMWEHVKQMLLEASSIHEELMQYVSKLTEAYMQIQSNTAEFITEFHEEIDDVNSNQGADVELPQPEDIPAALLKVLDSQVKIQRFYCDLISEAITISEDINSEISEQVNQSKVLFPIPEPSAKESC